MTMVTGWAPQLNLITPPFATALTTAADVQLAGVPVPTTRVGFDVSTARASAGTAARPVGLPAARRVERPAVGAGRVLAFTVGLVAGFFVAVGGRAEVRGVGATAAGAAPLGPAAGPPVSVAAAGGRDCGVPGEPQPAAAVAVAVTMSARTIRGRGIRGR
jgi:hypothetical protein